VVGAVDRVVDSVAGAAVAAASAAAAPRGDGDDH